MAVRPIRVLGDPVLRRRAEEVPAVDDEVRALIADMFDTMRAAEGIGLAAPQVGVSWRVLVADIGADGPGPLALVNPVLVEASPERERAWEGCLSLPGLEAEVERSVRVVVEGLDGEGRPIRLEAEGLLARCLQHEIDHLDGRLILDRVSPLKRRLLLAQWKKEQGRSGARPRS